MEENRDGTEFHVGLDAFVGKVAKVSLPFRAHGSNFRDFLLNL
jgi:hypothetical protein